MPEIADLDFYTSPEVKVAEPRKPFLDENELDSDAIKKMDRKHNATYYKPVDLVIVKGERCYCWDPEGKVYFDFAAAQGALNFGHCHPKIIADTVEQMNKLTICSRAFYNDQLSLFCKELGDLFGYEKVTPLNSGVEAGEAAVKLARKWGVLKKRVSESRNKIIVCRKGFFGRSLSAVSASTDSAMYDGFGPHLAGYTIIPFNDTVALEKALEGDPFISAFYVEPVQGEAGVFVPSPGYLKKCQEICKKFNVLFIVDEVQTGFGRTGKLAAYMHDGCHPDIVVLGKSLSGGLMPVSAIMSSKEVMDCFGPNGHGSTFGGCAVGCAAARSAIRVIQEENLVQRAAELGEILMARLNYWESTFTWIKEVRGQGCLTAFEIDRRFPVSAESICAMLKNQGIMAKQTHVYSIRLAPVLVCTDEELETALDAVENVLLKVDNPDFSPDSFI
eukprot:GHVP01047969.1.p1 GENE.GHVP01047969.1~~GHVP01047969.1.p1  ORF type:complete len:457 (+),score=81.06 GHVP01047969.1:36-1373(+)